MTSMSGPAALDSQSLQFRRLNKLQTVNDSTKNVYKNRTHLVATCSLYGLIFVGERSGIKVIVGGKIYEDGIACNPKNTVQAYVHRNIALPASPTHIDVNSDQKLLSVTFILYETPVLRIYSIETFFSTSVMVMNEVRLSSVSGTHINDLTWNPGNPALLACCLSDGTLTIYTFGPGSNVDIKRLPKESNSTCACWSPKGKQIAVGNINGFLTQYTPELKAMKNYPPPSNVFTKPCTITSLKWLSPFQFICAYSDQIQFVSNDEEIKTSIIVVNTPKNWPKNGPVSYISYEDICYSSGTTRPNQFYFLHVAQWNVVFVASANAIKVGVLSLSTEKNLLYQWNLDKSARVILPMNKTEEAYPVGVALDYGSQIQTPIGDALIPMPVFAVLTDEGFLWLYVINNMEQNAPCICMKPNPAPSLQCFTNANVTNEVLSPHQQPQQPAPAQIPSPLKKLEKRASSFEDASQKAVTLQKLREEPLKKLEKRATTFEGEIQSFKSLASDLRVDTETRPCNKIISLFQAKNKKLKELNGEIRNEIDNLKTSVIEVTGFVKDIKSQQFLLTNPRYRSLSSAQDLDTANLASLKNIEKNIHYVKSQIKLADEHLDEMWYKFCENLPESTTKVSELENVHHTIGVQQNILKIRKLEMQSLEKKLKEMRYRMSLVQPSGNSYESNYSTKSYESSSSKEDLALAELTRKILSLDSDSKTQIDATSVSAKCVEEYAKRFSLSSSKQIKLQELYGTHTVNYIRSTKLQRMKKKSLIILSKSSNVSEITPAPVKEQPNVNEIIRQQLISPVSSDDGVSDMFPPAMEKAASSTPLKGEGSGSLNVESTFVEEPSVIVIADESPKLKVKRPVILSAFRANKPVNVNSPAR